MPPRTLVAFDFDNTVINANSDTEIYKALPQGQLPAEVQGLYEEGQWTRFMNAVMAHMAQQGVTEQQLMAVLSQVQLTPGMQELLQHLSNHPTLYECIILSDANTLFIEWILAAHGLQSTFTHVFTNHAAWTPEGVLTIQPYHQHDCPLCEHTPNLCKKRVLREYMGVGQRDAYSRVLYLGDGSNDLCPCVSLCSTDAVFPRRGYPLSKLLQQPQVRQHVAAQVVEWESAGQVLQWLQTQGQQAG